ncbi:hypothetical protein GPJ56_000707 [Histomonas meleagridis]|uniref:uncharacterized protein n=1 Tax=Histomonas meleagridis TaxID=135588 RepID=UPI00355A2C3F|nr:hypothetical protein GPJ56_000707 [Histomonas meleagridis]KAH0804534.1 hypothetical protein GO595_003364 [Histomonas meleagridis]
MTEEKKPTATSRLAFLLKNSDLFQVDFDYQSIREAFIEISNQIEDFQKILSKFKKAESNFASADDIHEVRKNIEKLGSQIEQNSNEFSSELQETKSYLTYKLKNLRKKLDNALALDLRSPSRLSFNPRISDNRIYASSHDIPPSNNDTDSITEKDEETTSQEHFTSDKLSSLESENDEFDIKSNDGTQTAETGNTYNRSKKRNIEIDNMRKQIRQLRSNLSALNKKLHRLTPSQTKSKNDSKNASEQNNSKSESEISDVNSYQTGEYYTEEEYEEDEENTAMEQLRQKFSQMEEAFKQEIKNLKGEIETLKKGETLSIDTNNEFERENENNNNSSDRKRKDKNNKNEIISKQNNNEITQNDNNDKVKKNKKIKNKSDENEINEEKSQSESDKSDKNDEEEEQSAEETTNEDESEETNEENNENTKNKRKKKEKNIKNVKEPKVELSDAKTTEKFGETNEPTNVTNNGSKKYEVIVIADSPPTNDIKNEINDNKVEENIPNQHKQIRKQRKRKHKKINKPKMTTESTQIGNETEQQMNNFYTTNNQVQHEIQTYDNPNEIHYNEKKNELFIQPSEIFEVCLFVLDDEYEDMKRDIAKQNEVLKKVINQIYENGNVQSDSSKPSEILFDIEDMKKLCYENQRKIEGARTTIEGLEKSIEELKSKPNIKPKEIKLIHTQFPSLQILPEEIVIKSKNVIKDKNSNNNSNNNDEGSVASKKLIKRRKRKKEKKNDIKSEDDEIKSQKSSSDMPIVVARELPNEESPKSKDTKQNEMEKQNIEKEKNENVKMTENNINKIETISQKETQKGTENIKENDNNNKNETKSDNKKEVEVEKGNEAENQNENLIKTEEANNNNNISNSNSSNENIIVSENGTKQVTKEGNVLRNTSDESKQNEETVQTEESIEKTENVPQSQRNTQEANEENANNDNVQERAQTEQKLSGKNKSNEATNSKSNVTERNLNEQESKSNNLERRKNNNTNKRNTETLFEQNAEIDAQEKAAWETFTKETQRRRETNRINLSKRKNPNIVSTEITETETEAGNETISENENGNETLIRNNEDENHSTTHSIQIAYFSDDNEEDTNELNDKYAEKFHKINEIFNQNKEHFRILREAIVDLRSDLQVIKMDMNEKTITSIPIIEFGSQTSKNNETMNKNNNKNNSETNDNTIRVLRQRFDSQIKDYDEKFDIIQKDILEIKKQQSEAPKIIEKIIEFQQSPPQIIESNENISSKVINIDESEPAEREKSQPILTVTPIEVPKLQIKPKVQKVPIVDKLSPHENINNINSGKINEPIKSPNLIKPKHSNSARQQQQQHNEEENINSPINIQQHNEDYRPTFHNIVQQQIEELRVLSANDEVESRFLDLIICLRSQFQLQIDDNIKRLNEIEPKLYNFIDKEYIQKLFNKLRFTINEISGTVTQLKQAMPERITREELQNVAEELYKALTSDKETSGGTQSYKCLLCGRPKAAITGMITDSFVSDALGEPTQSLAKGNGQGNRGGTLIYGADKQLYKGKGNFGRTTVVSNDKKKLPALGQK